MFCLKPGVPSLPLNSIINWLVDKFNQLCEGTYLRYNEELVVPIIENTCQENELEAAMAAAMKDYPECPAVLVRRHGLYVWGPTWQKAKTM